MGPEIPQEEDRLLPVPQGSMGKALKMRSVKASGFWEVLQRRRDDATEEIKLCCLFVVPWSSISWNNASLQQGGNFRVAHFKPGLGWVGSVLWLRFQPLSSFHAPAFIMGVRRGCVGLSVRCSPRAMLWPQLLCLSPSLSSFLLPDLEYTYKKLSTLMSHLAL